MHKRFIIQILAADQNNVIGNRETNALPWRCKRDMQFFRSQTIGNVVIMGRKTFESFQCNPLPKRFNIVVSKTKKYDNVITVESIEEALQLAETVDLQAFDDYRKTKEAMCFIIGGAELFNSSEHLVDAVIISRIYNPNPVDDKNAIKIDASDKWFNFYNVLSLEKITVEEDGSFLNSIAIEYRNKKAVSGLYNKLNLSGFIRATAVSNIGDYDFLIDDAVIYGHKKGDRTGTGTISLFGKEMSFLLSHGAPIYTRRKLPLKSTIGELLWFISGSDDVNLLKNKLKCSFWDEWSDENGSIGKMYGYVWRNYNGFDQLKYVLDEMVNNPHSRRMVVDCWVADRLPDLSIQPKENPAKDKMALAPCHFSWQVGLSKVDENTKTYHMSLKWNQRSADIALGLPINIASYYLLLELLCKAATERNKDGWQYKAEMLYCSLGDAHIYENHLDTVRFIRERSEFDLPTFECPDGIADLIDNPTEEKLVEYQTKIFNGIKNYEAHVNIPIARNV